MKRLQIAISFYLLCFIGFSCSAIFDLWEWWDKAYYICADIGFGGWLLWWVIYGIVVAPYKKIVLPVLIFSIIVFIWDIISYITGIGANHPIATGIIFLIAVLTVLYLVIKAINWGKVK